MHEQTRSDRNRYVKINFENIIAGYESNFLKCGRCNKQYLPYDTSSVMHYPSHAFSANGKPTIVAKDGSTLGQTNGFSSLDIEKINLMYCSGIKREKVFNDPEWIPILVRKCDCLERRL